MEDKAAAARRAYNQAYYRRNCEKNSSTTGRILETQGRRT